MKLEFSQQFIQKIHKYQISWKSVQWEPSSSTRTDRRTDMKKLVVVFRNFLHMPTNKTVCLIDKITADLYTFTFDPYIVNQQNVPQPACLSTTGIKWHKHSAPSEADGNGRATWQLCQGNFCDWQFLHHRTYASINLWLRKNGLLNKTWL